jgi:hypothetical protein
VRQTVAGTTPSLNLEEILNELALSGHHIFSIHMVGVSDPAFIVTAFDPLRLMENVTKAQATNLKQNLDGLMAGLNVPGVAKPGG